MSQARKSGRWAGLTLAASALVLSATLLWVFGGRWLVARQALMGPESWAPTPEVLIDVEAPRFLAETLDGDTVAVPYAGSRSILIAYRTTCQFCDASVVNWRKVVEAVCDDAQVVLVSTEPLDVQRAYWANQPLHERSACEGSKPVIARVLDAGEVMTAYGFRGTPIHFIIGEDGIVHRTWRGAVGRQAAADSLIRALSSF